MRLVLGESLCRRLPAWVGLPGARPGVAHLEWRFLVQQNDAGVLSIGLWSDTDLNNLLMIEFASV